ncbi:MAG: hypothetical protein KJJ56_20720 [Serratia rubidaea]|nr:hypothetical protein [Serratia rubidaea]
MDYYGLFPKFKLNRPLNQEERAYQLHQRQPVELAGQSLVPDAKVISINSHYLELVDKYFASKGLVSLITAFGTVILLTGFLFVIIITPFKGGWPLIAVISLTNLPMGLWMLYLLKTEWFAWTHYPIRFDRKNRLVHVFRLDGSSYSVAWDSVFFTTGLNHRKDFNKDYYISGHVLAEDKVTVLDTFCLPATHGDRKQLERHWEFVRRYMEEGPEPVIGVVDFCLPIAEKREGFSFGLLYLMSGFNGAPLFLLPLFFVLASLFALPRYIAMLTSRRPRWPASIESRCRIAGDDPYRRDASDNSPHPWRDIFIRSDRKEKSQQ